MVSNASDDFPEPDRPVNTMSLSRGRSRSTLRRLCSRAPCTTSRSFTRGVYVAPPTIAHLFDVSGTHSASTCRSPAAGVMLTSWRDLTPSSTPRWCPSRTTPSSATGRPPRSSPCAARSTGCACPRSTRPPASPALLGTPDNGRWLLTVRDATTVTRRYLDDSFVLETTYETPHGTAVAQETMPLNDGRADLVRRLVCTRGQRRGRARVGRPVRLRRGRAVGAPHHRRGRRRRDPGDRRSGLAAAARRPAAPPRGPPARRPVHAARGRVGRAGAHLDAVVGRRCRPG